MIPNASGKIPPAVPCRTRPTSITLSVVATAEMTVPTLDGDESVQVPAGTQPGDVIVLRGRGVGRLRGRGRGDLLIHVNVLVPRSLTDDQRRLIEEFDRGAGPETYAEDSSFLGRIRAAFR